MGLILDEDLVARKPLTFWQALGVLGESLFILFALAVLLYGAALLEPLR